jgi:SAM-dependent methyltransferase
MTEPSNAAERVDALANVDAEEDPEPWLQMLRGMWSGSPDKEARYRQLYGRLGLGRGSRVLEVGCGTGGASRLLARSMPALGLVVGVDPSRLAVREAARAAGAAGERAGAPRVFAAMDGRSLGFCDASFDAAIITRVLVHAHDPQLILSETARVLRPGGRLLVVEPDRDGMLSSVEGDRVLRAFWSERRSVNPDVGRRLYPLLHRLGLKVEDVEASFNVRRGPPSERDVRELEQELAAGEGEYWELVRSGRITAAELATYIRGMREAFESGTYLRTDLEFVYVARKPARTNT